jgi:hypothetical protein
MIREAGIRDPTLAFLYVYVENTDFDSVIGGFSTG